MKLSTVDAFKHLSDQEGAIRLEGETLQKLQSVLFSILCDVLDVCDRNGIAYTLGGGSCLGAIRHKGFIPWDDDIDMNMLRPDYERFCSIFEEELGDKYWLHCPATTKGYGLGLARVRKKDTVFKGRDDINFDECGVFIDLFIVENAPNNPLVRKIHGFGSLALGFALSCRRFAAFEDEYMSLADGNAGLTKTFKTKIKIGKLFSFRSVDQWCRSWDSWNSLCKNNQSKYVVIPVGRKHYYEETYVRKDHFPPAQGVFCGRTVSVPAKTHPYLCTLYGEDYMTPPPVEERETHVVYALDLGEGL